MVQISVTSPASEAERLTLHEQLEREYHVQKAIGLQGMPAQGVYTSSHSVGGGGGGGGGPGGVSNVLNPGPAPGMTRIYDPRTHMITDVPNHGHYGHNTPAPMTKDWCRSAIMYRLQKAADGRIPYDHLDVHPTPERVFVFVVVGEKSVVLEDPSDMFPSDQLTTQLRLLIP